MKEEARKERLGVVLPNWLGDVIMAFPALRRFRRCFPETEVHLFCQSAFQVFMSWQEFASRTHPKDNGRLQGFRQAAELRRWKMDTVVVLPNSFRSGLEGWLIGSKRRVGYDGDRRSFLLTDRLPGKGDPSLHQSERYARLFRLLGMEGPLSLPRAEVPSETADAVRNRLLGREAAREAEYLAVSPGAGFGEAKRWPPKRFVQVCEALLGEAVDSVVVVGTARERGICDQVSRSLEERCPGSSINLAGLTTIDELSCVLRRASLCLSNDSGTMHLAAGLGVPTVGIFLSTSPEVSRPLGERVRWVASPVSCRPCFKRSCPTGTWDCLEAVDADTVIEEAMAVMRP